MKWYKFLLSLTVIILTTLYANLFCVNKTYAAILPATSFLSNTASAKVTTTTSWQIITATPSASNVTTIANQQKTTGYAQWQPGVNNATNAQVKPVNPNGKGFIYDTALDTTIPTGTWTFKVKTTNTSATGTGLVTICAWKVKITSGAISSSTNFINCVDGATNIQANTTALFVSTVSIASVPAVSLASNEYLYVEYWLHTTVAGTSTTGNIKFDVNSGATDSIVTPGSSINLVPNAPSQDLPANNATGQSSSPVFKMTAADPEIDNLRYKLTIYSNSACSTVIQTNDESTSQTGWSGQNATCVSGSDCYTSSTQGTYTTQTALSASTQYWWKASAKDPTGSNAFTNSTTCNTFTTGAPGSLSLGTPSSATLNAVTINTTAQNGTGSLGTITVTDTRGTNVGWNLTATASNFTSGTHTIAVTNFTINPSNGTLAVISGSGTGVSAGSSHIYTGTSDVASLMTASSGNGNGQYTINPSLTLTVPVGSYAGTYTATITETVQ